MVGASSGIGRALALAAGAAGATVALAARRLERLEQTAAEIRRAGGEATPLRCDVTDERSCRDLVDEAARAMGGIDTLLYLSGVSPLVKVADATPALWHELLATNLVGAATVIAAALPHLRKAQLPDDDGQSDGRPEQRHPVVVVTTTTMGDAPWPWLTVYGATKAGLAEMARGLRREEPGLRVICVAVGPTLTSFADGWDPETAAAAFGRWDEEKMMAYGVLEAHQMASAIVDAIVDTGGPDDVLIAADPPPPT